jgi:putative endonuclease
MRCSDDSLYTGITRNIKKRIWQHNYSKRGAKSVKGKLPVKLIYNEEYSTIDEALRREKEIKGWKKEKKEYLIMNALALRSETTKRR